MQGIPECEACCMTGTGEKNDGTTSLSLPINRVKIRVVVGGTVMQGRIFETSLWLVVERKRKYWRFGRWIGSTVQLAGSEGVAKGSASSISRTCNVASPRSSSRNSFRGSGFLIWQRFRMVKAGNDIECDGPLQFRISSLRRLSVTIPVGNVG